MQNRKMLAVAVAVASISVGWCSISLRADYTAARRITGLNQPSYLTQAPGDSQNLYIVQRSGTNNTVGDIVRYNTTTNTSSSFLNIGGSLVQDGGLLSMAFHPDYQTNGRFYVSALVGSTNKLFEYQTPAGGGTPTLQRTILSYDNPRTQHTIDWVGFKPNAVGAERDYLYVTPGDGGIQSDEASFTNRAQDPTQVFGKILRLDVNPSAADAYPADTNKNFAIPSINPFATASNGTLREVFATGFRNPWRGSFDRETGDLFIGDVGFNAKEEVSFHKNDAGFNSGRDFGWARREGTVGNSNPTHAGPQGTSINPIYEVDHSTNFSSMTGGYVYRGPIVELQGKYIFADFVSSKIFAITFDRDTDPSTFNGSTAGIVAFEDLTATINAKIAANGGGGPIRYLVSFGEDNAGNLYVVSFGSSFFPPLGTGAIYTLDAVAAPQWNIAGGGNWNTASNWTTNVIPNGPTASALLAGPAGSGTRTVNLSSAANVMRLTFDNAAASYNISGPQTLTVSANAAADAIVVAAGNHTISAPLSFTTTTRVNVASSSSLTITGSVSATSKQIIKRGGGTFVMPATNARGFDVSAGTLRLTGTGNSIVQNATVSAGATMDLTGSSLIVDYDAAASPRSAILDAVTSGRIVSSTITGSNVAIGYFDTAIAAMGSFNGATGIDSSTLILRTTLKGDTNLDRAVTFDDLLSLAQNYNGTSKHWQHGDSNFDGTVNFDDLLALAQNYNGSIALTDLTNIAGSEFAADWTLARSLVPEPATLALIAGPMSLVVRRRSESI